MKTYKIRLEDADGGMYFHINADFIESDSMWLLFYRQGEYKHELVFACSSTKTIYVTEA